MKHNLSKAGDGPSTEGFSGPRWLKIALSIFLVYHFVTVLLMPIGSSILGRKAAHFVTPYANTLGFNTTWQFFSPGPSPEFFLEYQVETREKSGEDTELERTRYPHERKPFSFDDFHNRKLYGMRFFALNPERLERYFIPFLCRQTPGAIAVSLQSVIVELPGLERASTLEPYAQIGERIDIPRQRYSCPAPDPALVDKADGAHVEVDPRSETDPSSQISEETGLPNAADDVEGSDPVMIGPEVDPDSASDLGDGEVRGD